VQASQTTSFLKRFPKSKPHVLLTVCNLGIKAKVENKGQYDEYVKELADIREELGIPLKEDMYPDTPFY
jgi:hypothetical protein